MRLKQVEVGESIMLQDGHWKKFGAIMELDTGDSEDRAWEIAVKEVENAKKKYLQTLPTEVQAESFDDTGMIDEELEAVKKKITEMEYQEDAEAFVIAMGFRFNMKLKNIINSKPSKNV